MVSAKFQVLLKTYNIKIQNPPDSTPKADAGDQIKMLFDQLISRYCTEVDLNIWFHTSFDEATKFNTCSLTEGRCSSRKTRFAHTADGSAEGYK